MLELVLPRIGRSINIHWLMQEACIFTCFCQRINRCSARPVKSFCDIRLSISNLMFLLYRGRARLSVWHHLWFVRTTYGMLQFFLSAPIGAIHPHHGCLELKHGSLIPKPASLKPEPGSLKPEFNSVQFNDFASFLLVFQCGVSGKHFTSLLFVFLLYFLMFLLFFNTFTIIRIRLHAAWSMAP